MPTKQWLRFAWTLNNYTNAELLRLEFLYLENKVTYLVFGKEICPSTGTPHLQGYVEFATKRSYGGVKRFLGNRIHVEHATSSASHNIAYCKKTRPEDPVPNAEVYEWGTPKPEVLHGNNAHERLAHMLRTRTPISEIAETDPYLFCRLFKGIDRYVQVTNSIPRTTKSTVVCLYGSTGTGKSRLAHEDFGITYTHPNDRWFDGYNHDKSVLFDDFDGISSGITYRKMLQLCDRYQMQVPVKGGFANWNPKVIVFTSNVHPRDWYKTEDYAPLERRIDYIWKVNLETIEIEKGPEPNNLELLGDNVYFNPYFE